MSFSFSGSLNTPQTIRPVDPWSPLEAYWNTQKAAADVDYTKAQTDYTQANSVSRQIQNEIDRINYGQQRYGWDVGLGDQVGAKLPAPPRWPTPPGRVAPQGQQGPQPDFKGGYGDEEGGGGGGGAQASPPPSGAGTSTAERMPTMREQPQQTRTAIGTDGNRYATAQPLPTPPMPPPNILAALQARQGGGNPNLAQLNASPDGGPPAAPGSPEAMAQLSPGGITSRYPGSYQEASLTPTPPPTQQPTQQPAQGGPPPAPPPQQTAQAQPQPQQPGVAGQRIARPTNGPPNPFAQLPPGGTSPGGLSVPGLGTSALPLPLATASLRDPAAAERALAQKRQVLATAASQATDLGSWNRGVANLWRQGWINNQEAQHYWNRPDLQESIITAQQSAEAQGAQRTQAWQYGMDRNATGNFQESPTVIKSRADLQAAEEAARLQYHSTTIVTSDGQTWNVQGDKVPQFYRDHAGAREATAGSVNYLPPERDSTYQTALATVPQQYRSMVVQAAREANVPLGMLVATLNTEQGGSNWNPNARGTRGEIGLGQILPSTGHDMNFTPDELRDPATNLRASATYLRMMLDKKNGNVADAAFAYNGINNPDYQHKWLTNYAQYGALVEPTGAQVGGGGGGAIAGPKNRTQAEDAVWDTGNKQLEKDYPEVTGRLADAKQSLIQQQQLRNIEETAKGLPTGSFGTVRAMIANQIATFAPKGFESTWPGQFLKATAGIDGSQAKDWAELQKQALAIAGQAQAGATSHGGLGMLNLYLHAFPGPDSPPEAISDMIHLFEVAHQYQIDHGQGSNEHFQAENHKFQTGNGKYQYPGLNEYDGRFQSSPLYQDSVYIAAAAILNHKPDWKKGLSEAQQTAALGVAARANPSGTVLYGKHPVSGEDQFRDLTSPDYPAPSAPRP